MNKTSLLVVWQSIGLMPLGANGQTVRYSFAGSVTLVYGLPFSGIEPQVGDEITGRFAYELGGSDDWVQPEISRYPQSLPSLLEIKLRGVNFKTEGNFYSYVQSNYFGFDAFHLADGYSVAGDDGDSILVNGNSDIGTVEIGLADNTSTAWNSDAFPAILDPAAHSSLSGQIAVLVNGEFSNVISGAVFDIHTLTAIPEPATALLLSTGALSLLSGWRRLRATSGQR